MPKQIKKRKHDDVEIQYITPKNKFRPYDEKARLEEEKLTQILFGGTSSFIQSLEEAEQESPKENVLDSGVGETDTDESDGDRKPAWVDEDDDGIDVGEALTLQNRKLPDGGVNSRGNSYYNLLKRKFIDKVGDPEWAKLGKSKNKDDSEDEEVLQSCGFIKKTARLQLPSGSLEFRKVTDMNNETKNEGRKINAVEFHPTSSVGFVGGKSGILSLFSIDGKRNHKLYSVHYEKFPIECARFINSGNEIIMGSHWNHFYVFDLLSSKSQRLLLPDGLTNLKKFTTSPDGKYIAATTGKWGDIHFLSSASREKLFSLKQDSCVTAFAFNPQSNLLFSHSTTGLVTIFDVNQRKIKHKFYDDGCIQGSTISISNSNQFLAAGSAQGIVNVYEMDKVLNETTPKPMKIISNLTTAIADLKFNSSSELLSISSEDTQNSIRLFHLGSKSVLSNFPGTYHNLGHVTTTNFSPGSGYYAVGDNKHKVSMFRLKHFKSY